MLRNQTGAGPLPLVATLATPTRLDRCIEVAKIAWIAKSTDLRHACHCRQSQTITLPNLRKKTATQERALHPDTQLLFLHLLCRNLEDYFPMVLFQSGRSCKQCWCWDHQLSGGGRHQTVTKAISDLALGGGPVSRDSVKNWTINTKRLSSQCPGKGGRQRGRGQFSCCWSPVFSNHFVTVFDMWGHNFPLPCHPPFCAPVTPRFVTY